MIYLSMVHLHISSTDCKANSLCTQSSSHSHIKTDNFGNGRFQYLKLPLRVKVSGRSYSVCLQWESSLSLNWFTVSASTTYGGKLFQSFTTRLKKR